MKRRKRQLRLLGDPPKTRPLFPGGEYEGCAPDGLPAYELPDEIAYNARRKAEGLFNLNPEEEEKTKP